MSEPDWKRGKAHGALIDWADEEAQDIIDDPRLPTGEILAGDLVAAALREAYLGGVEDGRHLDGCNSHDYLPSEPEGQCAECARIKGQIHAALAVKP